MSRRCRTRRDFIGWALAASAGVVASCGRSPAAPTPNTPAESSTVADADGNVYRTVKIGTQWWMAENLRTRRAVGATALPGAYAYSDLESHVATYGRLYTWTTAMLPLVAGWHLPTEAEWTTLINTVGAQGAGNALRLGGSSGFNAVLGGYRFYDGSYQALGSAGHYWSSTMNAGDHAWKVGIYSNEASAPISGFGIAGAVSVRLVRDSA